MRALDRHGAESGQAWTTEALQLATDAYHRACYDGRLEARRQLRQLNARLVEEGAA